MCSEIFAEEVCVDIADGAVFVKRDGASLTCRLTHCHTSGNYSESARRLRLRRDRSARNEEIGASLGNESAVRDRVFRRDLAVESARDLTVAAVNVHSVAENNHGIVEEDALGNVVYGEAVLADDVARFADAENGSDLRDLAVFKALGLKQIAIGVKDLLARLDVSIRHTARAVGVDTVNAIMVDLICTRDRL